jgi:hypothetical protein
MKLFFLTLSFLFLTPAFAVSPKGITYNCPGIFGQKARALMAAVLSEAFVAFDKINPLVGEILENRLESKRLVIDCTMDERLIKHEALAIANNYFFRKSQIAIGKSNLELSTFNKSILLHELLHFAKLDNFPLSKHNNILKDGEAHLDYVYTCSLAVYYNPFYGVSHESALKTCSSIE